MSRVDGTLLAVSTNRVRSNDNTRSRRASQNTNPPPIGKVIQTTPGALKSPIKTNLLLDKSYDKIVFGVASRSITETRRAVNCRKH